MHEAKENRTNKLYARSTVQTDAAYLELHRGASRYHRPSSMYILYSLHGHVQT